MKTIKLSEDWQLYKYVSEWKLSCAEPCVFVMATMLPDGSSIGPLKNCASCNKLPSTEIIQKAKLLGFK